MFAATEVMTGHDICSSLPNKTVMTVTVHSLQWPAMTCHEQVVGFRMWYLGHDRS